MLIMLGLLLYLYVIDPLWEQVKNQQQQVTFIQKKADKVSRLLQGSNDIEQELKNLQENFTAITPYVFTQADSGQLKLAVQQHLELTLEQAGCTLKSLSWQGESPITSKLTKWQVELLYKGSPVCLLNVTKAVESETPLLVINDYQYRGRYIDGKPSKQINARLNLSLWQLVGVEQ